MFDCVPFFNELDLLEIRMNVLDEIIERFVIVESTRTFSGKPKPLYFVENDQRFKKFWPKIIHLVHHGFPLDTKGSGKTETWGPQQWTWFNENTQRNKVLESLKISRPSDNLLLLSDTDEIPDPQKLLEARQLALEHRTPISLELFPSMYWMNYAVTDGEQFRGPYIFDPDLLVDYHKTVFHTDQNDPSSVRFHVQSYPNRNDFITVKDAGWHFSTLGNLDDIRRKLESFSHHDQFNNEKFTSEDYILKCMVKGIHVYLRDPTQIYRIQPMNFLPQYVRDNADKYQKYII